MTPGLATGLVSVFVLFYSVFFALTLTVVRYWVEATVPRFRRSQHLAIRSLPLCAGWMVFEQANYLTALDTSFPWLDIGYAFTDTWLAGLASIGGITLVSAAVLAVVVGLLMFSSMPRTSFFLIGLPWIAGALTLQQEWTQAEKEIDVALVQANVSLAQKFSEDGFDLAWNAHVDLTTQAQGSELVVWPEGAVPAFEHQLTDHLFLMARRLNTTILSGVYIREGSDGSYKFYNGVVSVEPNGHVRTFLKYKLVPFGEYTPLEWIFGSIREGMDIPNSDLDAGPSEQKPFRLDCCSLGISICYEIAFPYLIGQRADQTDFLVAMSEDGWFGNSMGPAQHMQIARMRAIETQRYVLRVTSSGITGIVDPKGKLIETLPLEASGVLTSTIETRTGSTPFMFVAGLVQGMFGDFFMAWIFASLPILLLVGVVQNRRTQSKM